MRVLDGTPQIFEAAKTATDTGESVVFSVPNKKVFLFVPWADKKAFDAGVMRIGGALELHREAQYVRGLTGGWLIEPVRPCSPEEFADLFEDIKTHGENLNQYRLRTMQIFGDNTPDDKLGLIAIIFKERQRRGEESFW